MNRHFGLVACAAAVVVGGVSAAHADDAKVKKELEARYKQVVEAYKRKDVNRVAALATPDFTWKEKNGTVIARAVVFNTLKQSFAKVKTVDSETSTIVDLKVKGSQAVATEVSRLSATLIGPGGKDSKLATIRTSDDTWVKAGGVWKIKQIAVTSSAMTVDGKPMGPRPNMPSSMRPTAK